MSCRFTIVTLLAGFGIVALCATKSCGTRQLPYAALRESLLKAGVHLER